MTINKDGTTRKKRVNNPTNFEWDDNSLILAFYCYRADINPIDKQRVADKLGIGLEALNARINEYQILENRGKTEKVAKKTESIYLDFKNKLAKECENKIELYLGKHQLDTNIDDEDTFEVPEEGENEIEDVDESIFLNSSSIELVPTLSIIDKIIHDGFFTYNGKYINEKNLIHLKAETDLSFIDSAMMGCYFIFSNIPKENVPLFGSDGYQCFDKFLEKDGIEYRCLYNGKSEKVKERLKIHLFNSHTLEKVKTGKAKTISGTGAISLISLTQSEFDDLREKKQYDPAKHKLKPVGKSLQPETLDKREGHAYFLNGIDITENPWTRYKFAVLVLKSDSEFGKILIEEAFCKQNGRPPLCRRHG